MCTQYLLRIFLSVYQQYMGCNRRRMFTSNVHVYYQKQAISTPIVLPHEGIGCVLIATMVGVNRNRHERVLICVPCFHMSGRHNICLFECL